MKGIRNSTSQIIAPGTLNSARATASGTAISADSATTSTPSNIVLPVMPISLGSPSAPARAEKGAASEPRPSSGKIA